MQGILADVNVLGLVHYLAQLMQAGSWAEFWQALGLILRRFEDVGLAATASDLDVWQRCQAQGLILITDNRNADAADSLEAVIRQYNTPQSLPVFTIADLDSSAPAVTMLNGWWRSCMNTFLTSTRYAAAEGCTCRERLTKPFWAPPTPLVTAFPKTNRLSVAAR